MRAIKIFLILGILFGLQGCFSTSKNYYILSMISQPSVVFKTQKNTIGINKVTVPGYLYKRDIAIAKSSSQITLLGDALWGEDLDTGLTNRLIGFIQKKFNQPDVFAYPWGVDRQPNIIVSAQITRFIAQGEYVYLDVRWSLEDAVHKRRKAKLFSTTVATKGDVQSIVLAMDKAFGRFEETVARGIKVF